MAESSDNPPATAEASQRKKRTRLAMGGSSGGTFSAPSTPVTAPPTQPDTPAPTPAAEQPPQPEAPPAAAPGNGAATAPAAAAQPRRAGRPHPPPASKGRPVRLSVDVPRKVHADLDDWTRKIARRHGLLPSQVPLAAAVRTLISMALTDPELAARLEHDLGRDLGYTPPQDGGTGQ